MNRIDKRYITSRDVCKKCGKDLRFVNEIHVTEGMHFCSKLCAIKHYIDDINLNAEESAISMYNDFAEVVTTVDIGLVRKETVTSYAPSDDMTFILEKTYDMNDDCVSTEVIGFYHGEPNDEDTEVFKGSFVAVYDIRRI